MTSAATPNVRRRILVSSFPNAHYILRLTHVHADDMTAISPELEQELRKLEHMFTVDAAKLKQISLQFEHELRQGLSRVSRCLLPSNVSPSRSDVIQHLQYLSSKKPTAKMVLVAD